jgi:hypothetical protein
MGYRRRSPWSLAGRLAPVLLLFAVAAPRASAACGDHVQIIPATAAATPTTTPVGEPEAPASRSPCGGQKCDQVPPDRTPPAPPTATADGPQHDAALFAVPPAQRPDTAAHPADAGVSPRDSIASIFHPPRP